MRATMFVVVMSLAVALDIHGEIVRGYPCVRRHNQLYCSTPGPDYPRDQIDLFIDENKALIRRMFGEFQPNSGPINATTKIVKRQTKSFPPPPAAPNSSSRIDSCESSTEIVTPYWASNSANKVRAIVNTQHFEQAIQQEVCLNVQTKRCMGDCGCEQKYKWHRLLAFDPDDKCKGIFMDWFLFPSCCVCKCAAPKV
ncbi:hypothetical protein CHUAL_010869 [Chamberlinius hualienensis]